MAEKTSPIHLCDETGHHDDIAEAFCQFHKKLLCISCVVEKTKSHSPDCSIMLIRDVIKEKDVAILECLSIRQTAKRKHKLIDVHEDKVERMKTDLVQKVNETHSNLSSCLDALKDKCLKSISEQAESITKAGKSCKNRIQEIETTLSEFVEALSTETVDNFDELLSKIKVIKEEINKRTPDKITVPEGDFKPNDRLSSYIMKSDTSIGNVSVIDRDHYEKIETQTEMTQINASSDEIGDRMDKSTQTSSEIDKTKTDRKSYGFFRWFSFRSERRDLPRRKSNETETFVPRHKEKTLEAMTKTMSLPAFKGEEENKEEIYEDCTFIQPMYTPPKYLINKTVNVDIKQEDFTSACKFSKLVGVGKSYIGMLSDVHKSLVFVGTEGQFLGRKRFQASKVEVAATGVANVAVLTEPSGLVRQFRINEKGIQMTGSFTEKEMKNITGFDYDLATSMYAVSSSDKISILDKTGKLMKCVKYSEKDTQATNNIITTFDFKTECIYILKVNEKTLKSYSLKTSKVVWKRKIDGDSVLPRSMCLHRDRLYVTCSDAVAIFSAGTGEPIDKHEVKDILEDCLGMCVIEDTLVLSSNSDDFTKSTTFAYISV